MNPRVYEVVRTVRLGSRPVAKGTVFNEQAPNGQIITVGREMFRPEDEDQILAAERRLRQPARKTDVRSVLLGMGVLKEIR